MYQNIKIGNMEGRTTYRLSKKPENELDNGLDNFWRMFYLF